MNQIPKKFRWPIALVVGIIGAGAWGFGGIWIGMPPWLVGVGAFLIGALIIGWATLNNSN